MSERAILLRRGLRYELLTIAWMFTEAVATIVAGVIADSALLLAVGAGSAIDMFSACALYYRFRLELRDPANLGIHSLEIRTAKLVAILLLLTALYVIAMSAHKLLTRTGAGDSYVAIAVALVAAIWMPFLAKSKTDLAEELSSPALRADGIGTLVCGFMSQVLLVGLVANLFLRWWWLDSVGALIVVPLLVKEGREAWRGSG